MTSAFICLSIHARSITSVFCHARNDGDLNGLTSGIWPIRIFVKIISQSSLKQASSCFFNITRTAASLPSGNSMAIYSVVTQFSSLTRCCLEYSAMCLLFVLMSCALLYGLQNFLFCCHGIGIIFRRSISGTWRESLGVRRKIPPGVAVCRSVYRWRCKPGFYKVGRF